MGQPEGKTLGQVAALAIGLSYAVGGVIGFAVTGFAHPVAQTGHKFLGASLNPFHDLIHVAIGLPLIWAARRDTAITEGVLLGVGGVYVVAAITGFIYAHLPVLTITTFGNADNYVHLITGVTATLAALASAATVTGHKRRR